MRNIWWPDGCNQCLFPANKVGELWGWMGCWEGKGKMMMMGMLAWTLSRWCVSTLAGGCSVFGGFLLVFGVVSVSLLLLRRHLYLSFFLSYPFSLWWLVLLFKKKKHGQKSKKKTVKADEAPKESPKHFGIRSSISRHLLYSGVSLAFVGKTLTVLCRCNYVF